MTGLEFEQIYILSVVFIFGLVIGSFLNVVVHRLPRGESLVRPGSHCPGCSSPIRPRDNIPLLSYLFLLGKCRTCGTKISPRYPAIELLEAVLLTLLVYRFGLVPQVAPLALFVSVLVVVSFIDIDLQIIPDKITVPMMIIGALGASTQWLVSFATSSSLTFWPISIKHAVIGWVVGLGILILIIEVFRLLTGKTGMGFGDVKMLGMIGLYLGWQKALLTLFLGCFAGSFISIPLMLFSGKTGSTKISFGPFLALGALFSLFYGDIIIDFYRHSFSQSPSGYGSPW